MTHQQRLENPLYKNWIRGALGLGYVHEGLYGFVNKHSQKLQKELLAEVLSKGQINDCTLCTLNNLLPEHASTGRICIQKTKSKCLCSSKSGRRICPNSICSRMYDLIVDQHVYSDPFWKNTDPRHWCSDHWSIARCFHTSTNYSSSAKDTDTSGLLAIIISNLYMQQELSASISLANTDPFSRARDIRNEILHSPTLELQDTEMLEYIDAFIDVLSDQKAFHYDEAAKKAITNLIELKKCPIFINLKDELQLRKDAMQALEEKKSDALSEIETAQVEALRQIETSVEAKNESETEKKQVEKTQENVKSISTKLKKINTSQIIGQRKQRQIDDRLKTCEENQAKLMENVRIVQENLQTQTENIEHRQSSQDQVCQQLSAQIKELQKKIDEIQSPNRDSIVKEEREQYTLTLQKQLDLQTNLITLYHQYYLKTDVSPLLPEEDVDIDEIYVPLKMEKVNKHGQKYSRKSEPVYFYEDMFFQAEGPMFRSVFITADAGIGKTTFCRKLTSTWCKVHSQNCQISLLNLDTNYSKFRTKENIESRDRHTMSKFTYLFYISLRHTDKEATIEDMICSQLLDENSKDIIISILKEYSNRCLVVLDGLDEWEAPYKLPKSPFITSGLPDKEVKMSYVTLYTTRPWKLEKIRPKTGEVDLEIKLIGIDSSAAKKLAKAVIERLNENSNTAIKDVDNFMQRLGSNHFQNLESIPILLKLLACLWHEDLDVGSSLCAVYSSVLEQLLRIALERNVRDEEFVKTLEKLQTHSENTEQSNSVRNIFQNKSNCQTLIQFLKVLSKIAFKALLGDGKKANLVFEGSFLATLGISDMEMQFCLKTGILSQRLLLGKSAINRCKSVTFIHKTFQEFFAALYVVISDENKAFDILLNIWQDVEKVLEMGKVIQFIGGMSPQLLCKISEHIVKLTDVDDRFISYRAVDSSRILILMIQDLMFLSVKESLACTQATLPNFHLRDVHLWDEDMNKYVLNFDPLSVKSLSTNSSLTDAELIHITKTSSLKLLCFSGLFGKFPKKEFFNILDKSSDTLVCLAIKTGGIERQEQFHFSKLQNLRKISLSDVTVSHTTMYRLLTDSEHMLECHAMCVYCFSDETCQCNNITDTETPTMLKSTEIKRFESSYGCGMLRHISKAERLEELRVLYPNDPAVVKDIIRITQSCKSMKIMQLHGIESELLTIPLPRSPSSLCSVKLSELNLRPETILDLLHAGKNADESCIFEFEDVTLTTGHIDKLKEEIENSGIFQIKYIKKRFKVKGKFRRAKFKNSLDSGSTFSMGLVKNTTNKETI